MIEVEKFGGGALRVSYDDGRDDWMFWPFENNGGAGHVEVVGENRVLAVHSYASDKITVALFDADSRARLAQRQIEKLKVTVPSDGEHIVFAEFSGENRIVVVSGHDLSELLRFEDKRLDAKNILYHRHDGAIVLGTPSGPDQAVWEITFDGEKASVNALEGIVAPQGLDNSHNTVDPAGRRVVTVGAEKTPIEKEGGKRVFGVPLSVWNLQTLEVERTIVVDRLPLEFSWDYRGQDRLRAGDPERVKWEEYVEHLNLGAWDGDLEIHRSSKELRDRPKCGSLSGRRGLISGFVRSLAWEPDGEAFWVLFCAGFLRRVGIDGSISPRYVVRRMATPPALRKRRWNAKDFYDRQKAYGLHCLADGSLRIVSLYEARDGLSNLAKMTEIFMKGGESEFDPARARRSGGFLRRLFGTPAEEFHVPMRADGFAPEFVKKADKKKMLKSNRIESKAVAARKAAFLAQTAESTKRRETEHKQRLHDDEAARKAARPPGSVDVEKFGYTCGGALRVEYVGSGEDWMFLPFRDRNLSEFHLLGNDRILAYASQELALFDVKKKECVARKRVGVNLKLHASTNGERIALVGKVDGETDTLTIFGGNDLEKIFVMEEEGLNYTNPIYERYDDALILAGITPGPVRTAYVVTFENGGPKVEKRVIEQLPGAYQNSWPCPTRHRVLARVDEPSPVLDEAGAKSFGVSVNIWNLATLEIERTVVLDQLQANLKLPQDYGFDKWDSLLRPDPSLDDDTNRQILELSRKWHAFVKMNLRAIAWEPDGEAFWVAFAGGYVRRVDVDGSVSQRIVIERLRPSEATGEGASDLREMAVLPDGRIQIEFYARKSDRIRYTVCFRPPPADALSDAQAPDITIPEEEDWLGEVLVGYPTRDDALKARMKAFEEHAKDAPFPLVDISAASCIDAIECLTAAIDKDPCELVCGYNFRPTFVYAEGTPDERRMGEDVFFAHVAANAPEARDAVERLLHTWMDRVPLSAKHRNYYMNDHTVALSHALKALIALDPCCYDTIRRYVTETDLGHDAIIQNEVLPYFGQVNGWRDVDAIKLGIFCMLEAWCAGSGGSWICEAMRNRVEQAMNGREFAGVLIRETQRYFSPDESSFNREAWNHNNVRGYLEQCGMMNFNRGGDFDRDAMAVINDYLKPTSG